MKISYSLERSLLQGAVALAAAVPVSAGLSAIFGGADLLGLTGDASGDSHVRYLSGLLLGIGLAFWTMIPDIETYADRFRLLTSVVFVGGCARLFGIAAFGAPEVGVWMAIIMELFVTQILCIWQNQLAARAPVS